MKFSFLTSSKGALPVQVIVIAISSLFVLIILMFLFGNFFTGDDRAFALDEFSKCKSFGGKCVHSSNCEDKVAGVDCRNSNHVCCKVEESQRKDVKPPRNEDTEEDERIESSYSSYDECYATNGGSSLSPKVKASAYATCRHLIVQENDQNDDENPRPPNCRQPYCDGSSIVTPYPSTGASANVCSNYIDECAEGRSCFENQDTDSPFCGCLIDSACPRGHECDTSTRKCVEITIPHNIR